MSGRSRRQSLESVGSAGGGPGIPPGGTSPIDVPNLALWLRADQGIVFGGMFAPVATGTTPPTVTFSGTPSATVQSFDMTCTILGILGTSHVNININGVSVYAGISAASLGPFSGITVHIAAGAMAINDEWTSVPSVASWTSIGGTATVFTQATTADMPAWIAPGLVLNGWHAGLNGQAAVRFDGAASLLTNSAFVLAQAFSFYCAISTISVSGNATIFADTTNVLQLIAQTTPRYLLSANGFSTFGVLGVVGFPAAGLLSGIASGVSAQFPISHQTMGGTIGNVGFTAGLSLGAAAGPIQYWNGDLQELAFYGGAVSALQDNSLRGYFCNRYALP